MAPTKILHLAFLTWVYAS